MADPLALSGYRKVYVPTSKASVVSVYTAAEVDRLLLNYMPAYVAKEIEGIDVESYFVENVIIANTMVTNVLTAQKGYIAELTVDEIDTSRFIPMYLASNKAKVKYWRGYEQRIDFYHATYAGDIGGQPNTTQVTDRNGNLLYWIDADHIGNGWTYDVTDYPVMRYVYDGVDTKGILKLTIRDDNDAETGYDFPMMIWGAGNGAGRQKGYIYKDSDEMVMSYENADGEMREIRLGEDGVTITPYQLEALSFTSNGFSATYSGQTYSWGWTKDGTGKITQLAIDGRTIPVTWPV